MDIFRQALSHIAQKRATKLDCDYEKDSILYCGKCNKPKEMVLTIGNFEPMIVAIACDCIKKEQNREEENAKLFKRREGIIESINGLISIGAARMPRFNFSMCDGSNKNIQTRMEKYANNYDKVYDKNIGLILFGNTGTGKTFFAECIADALIQKGRFALLTSVSGLVNSMTSNFNENRSRILHYVRNVDLLILDDFGTERNTSFMNEQMFDIVDARYIAKRPMIITTNLSPEAMKASEDIHIHRIIDRLTEFCVAIEVKGESRRGTKVNDKVKDLMEIWG